MPGGMDLKNEVFQSSTCALCGACLDWCPYIANMEDHLVMRFDCNVGKGAVTQCVRGHMLTGRPSATDICRIHREISK